MNKVCSKCQETKPIEEFYRDRTKVDGRHTVCKCCADQTRRNRYQSEDYRNRVSDRSKQRYRSPEGQAKHAAYIASGRAAIAKEKYRSSKKGKATERAYKQSAVSKAAYAEYRVRCHQKRRARGAVSGSVHGGRLPRVQTLSCIHCGEPANFYHHHNGYDEEHKLDVIPLCAKCDCAAHKA